MLSRIFIAPDDIDETSNAVRVDLLSLPHARLKDIFVDGKSIAPANYTLHDKDIRLSGDARLTKASKIWAYVDIPTRRIRNERYAALAAIIGAAGAIAAAIIQSGWLDLSSKARMADFVTFKPDPYAVNAENATFSATINWQEPGERTFTFDKAITETDDVWAFVQLWEPFKNPREALVKNVHGFSALRNGMALDVAIQGDLLERYRQGKGLQLIVIAAPRGRKIVDGQTIAEIGPDAKVIVSQPYLPLQ
jgi:hypothetical protein